MHTGDHGTAMRPLAPRVSLRLPVSRIVGVESNAPLAVLTRLVVVSWSRDAGFNHRHVETSPRTILPRDADRRRVEAIRLPISKALCLQALCLGNSLALRLDIAQKDGWERYLVKHPMVHRVLAGRFPLSHGHL